MATAKKYIPYLERVTVNRQSFAQSQDGHNPLLTQFPWLGELDLKFEQPITLLVGENGSGKSALLEALADKLDLPLAGGSRGEISAGHGVNRTSLLCAHLRAQFKQRPNDAFFFRADYFAHFASLLDARVQDPDFDGDPYARYGGKSLHQQSHGEAFFSALNSRIGRGIYLLDEPEAALSPNRQIEWLRQLLRNSSQGQTQLIIATHSVLLMSLPAAQIISFDGQTLAPIALEDTAHFRLTQIAINSRATFWEDLQGQST